MKPEITFKGGTFNSTTFKSNADRTVNNSRTKHQVHSMSSKLRALNNSHRENLQNQCFCNHWLLIKLIQNKFCLSLVVRPPPVLQLCHWRSDRTLHSTGHQTPQRKPGIQTVYFAQLTTKPIKNLSLPFATRTKPTS